MLELNKVFLTGNLTRDPEIKSLPSGKAVAELRLAVNRRWFDRDSGEKREDTLFIDISAWERTADFCKNYLRKGSGIFVEGRLKQDTWEDKQSGQNRSKISVIADRIQFADSRPSDAGAGSGESRGASFRNNDMVAEAPLGAGAPQDTTDDLPF